MATDVNDRVRGAGGQFISEKEAKEASSTSLPKLIHKSSKMTGALKTIKNVEEEKELEKPLVSVNVNNPISWLLKWINQIRKKQTTTFMFKLGVPLIALPILIFALATLFYNLNKITNPIQEKIIEKEPSSYATSKVGLLKILSESGQAQYFLILADGEAVKLEPPEGTDLSKLDNRRILASGTFFTKSNTIKVDNIADLEILPASPKNVPSSSPTPIAESPTPTLEVTQTPVSY